MKTTRLLLLVTLILSLLAPTPVLAASAPSVPTSDPIVASSISPSGESSEESNPLEVPHLYSPELDQLVKRVAITSAAILVVVIIISIAFYVYLRRRDDYYYDDEDDEEEDEEPELPQTSHPTHRHHYR